MSGCVYIMARHVFMYAGVSAHDANGIINGTILFARVRWSKWDFGHVMPSIGTSISIMWCQWHHQWYHCICFIKIVKMDCNISYNVMHLVLALTACDADSIINGTTAFVSSWWSKWGTTWHFWYCDTTHVGITLYHWHCTLYLCIYYVKMIKMRCDMMFLFM